MSVYTGSIGPWPNLYVIHKELKSKQSAQHQRLVSNEHLDTIPLQHLQMFSAKVKLGYSRLPLYRNIITKTDQDMVAIMHIQANWNESTHLAFALKGSFLKFVYFKGSTTQWEIFIYFTEMYKINTGRVKMGQFLVICVVLQCDTKSFSPTNSLNILY